MNSRCQTPFNSSSPVRHNTPASRLGQSDPEDIGELNECHHLTKLQLSLSRGDWKNYRNSVITNWSSSEEEAEEVSKILRHLETDRNGSQCLQKIGSQSAAAWEGGKEIELLCQREEAKIQAWVNLESAKAEAQSRKP